MKFQEAISDSDSGHSDAGSTSSTSGSLAPAMLRWADMYNEVLGGGMLERFRTTRPVKVATACSGSGAPIYALHELLTRPGHVKEDTVVEVMASDSNTKVRDFYLANLKVEHLYLDIQSVRLGHGPGCCPPPNDLQEDRGFLQQQQANSNVSASCVHATRLHRACRMRPNGRTGTYPACPARPFLCSTRSGTAQGTILSWRMQQSPS